jgi:hypothetical protein
VRQVRELLEICYKSAASERAVRILSAAGVDMAGESSTASERAAALRMTCLFLAV